MQKKHHRHFNFKYKNITLLLFGFVTAVLLGTNPYFGAMVTMFSSLGVIGALVAGALFVSSFTVAIGALLIGLLLPSLGVWKLVIGASIGAIICDLVIFKFVKNSGLIGEILPIYKKLGGSHLNRLFKTKLFNWTLPIVGALIIASPLPDEIGVTLMGISKIKTWQFVVLSLLLNSLGIFLLVLSISLLGK